MEWTLLHSSPDSSGAFWLWFQDGVDGRLSIVSRNLTEFPFAIQVHWLPQDGSPEPLFFGYELDFRHAQGVVAAGIGSTGFESPPLESLPPFSAGTTLSVVREGAGHLGVAWSRLPEGISISGSAGLLAQATSTLAAEMVSLTIDADGPHVFTPGVQAQAGKGTSRLGLPNLLNLRLVTPTNAGKGQVSVTGSSMDWSREVPAGSPNASCVDCFEVRRFVAALDQPWSFSSSYVGRSGSFQAHLMVVEVPGGASPSFNRFLEFADCATAFQGCG